MTKRSGGRLGTIALRAGPRRIARGRDGVGALIFIVAAVALPWVVGSGQLFIWTTVLIAVLFATSTNLLFGVGNIPSFGQAAFFGAGAYTVALLAAAGWPAPLSVCIGAAVGGAVAGVTALLTWRVTGLIFAMLTLAVAQALYTLAINVGFLGGFDGLPGVTPPPLGAWNLASVHGFWYFAAVCVGVGMLAFWRIGRSPFGVTLCAIRENPVRARYMGINVRAYRAIGFALAGCGAGLAGGLSAYANEIVTPSTLFWTASAAPIIMLLLGGRSYFWGPAVGAALLTWLTEYLSQVTPAYIFYIGLVLLGVLVLFPDGLLSLGHVALEYIRVLRFAPTRGKNK